MWNRDKKKFIDKFVEDSPMLAQFDSKFIFYTDIATEMDEEPDYKIIQSIRVNKRPLLNQIKNHALEWKELLGESLTNNTVFKMQEFLTNINVTIVFIS